MSSTASYFQAIRTGARAGVNSITEAMYHPIDQMIKPAATFTIDLAATLIPYRSNARIAARGRMGDRFNSIINIFEAEGPEQARMAAKLATGLFLSVVGLRMVRRVARFSSPLFSPPPIQREVRLTTASGDRGILAYSHRYLYFSGKTCYVYVDRLQAEGMQTATLGLVNQTLSILKQHATENGAQRLHIEAQIVNRKLARLAQKRYGRNFSINENEMANIKIPLR